MTTSQYYQSIVPFHNFFNCSINKLPLNNKAIKYTLICLCVVFHRFPTDPVIRKRWVVALMRKNFIPSGHSRLCSKHFTEGSYQIRPNRILKLLKPDAVPTLFDFPDHLNVENSTATIEVSIYYYHYQVTLLHQISSNKPKYVQKIILFCFRRNWWTSTNPKSSINTFINSTNKLI